MVRSCTRVMSIYWTCVGMIKSIIRTVLEFVILFLCSPNFAMMLMMFVEYNNILLLKLFNWDILTSIWFSSCLSLTNGTDILVANDMGVSYSHVAVFLCFVPIAGIFNCSCHNIFLPNTTQNDTTKYTVCLQAQFKNKCFLLQGLICKKTLFSCAFQNCCKS